MQSTIVFKAGGRSSKSPVKVLQALDISSKPVSAAQFLLQVLSGISVSSVLRLVFGERASLAVASVCAAAMWWHLLSISEGIAAGQAVALDAALSLPWALVALFAFLSARRKEVSYESLCFFYCLFCFF